VVVETSTLSESELSQYCREKGLYPQQVHGWQAECIQGFQSSAEDRKTQERQNKASKAEIKSLKKELRSHGKGDRHPVRLSPFDKPAPCGAYRT